MSSQKTGQQTIGFDVAARCAGWVSVTEKRFAGGARGDGTTNDTDAIAEAVAAAAAVKGVVFFPPGTYRTDTITIPSYVTMKGSGWFSTILRPRVNTASVLLIDRQTGDATGYQCGIEDLRIVGLSSGTGHGIEATGVNDGATNLRIRNVFIYGMGGDGIHFEECWSVNFENVLSSTNLGHQFYIGTILNTITFTNCYAKGLPTAGRAGWRVLSGHVTFVNCNGIDPIAGVGSYWGDFGQAVAMGDASNSTVHALFIGCNIEDFQDTGLVFRFGSRFSLWNTTFVAPSSGTVKAIYLQNTNTDTPGLIDPTTRFGTKGASWANSVPVHCELPPPVIKFGEQDFLSAYSNVGANPINVPILRGRDFSTALLTRGGIFIADDSTTGTRVKKHISGTATWDPGSIADGAMTSTTVTVTGAAVGDTTAVGFSQAVPAGAILSGSVTATNTVTVTLFNKTGAPLDLASGTLRADVWQH